jgi:hypothetical protein
MKMDIKFELEHLDIKELTEVHIVLYVFRPEYSVCVWHKNPFIAGPGEIGMRVKTSRR